MTSWKSMLDSSKSPTTVSEKFVLPMQLRLVCHAEGVLLTKKTIPPSKLTRVGRCPTWSGEKFWKKTSMSFGLNVCLRSENSTVRGAVSHRIACQTQSALTNGNRVLVRYDEVVVEVVQRPDTIQRRREVTVCRA